MAVEEALKHYERRVEGKESEANDGEQAELLSPLARLREKCRRYSVAEHVMVEREKKYTG